MNTRVLFLWSGVSALAGSAVKTHDIAMSRSVCRAGEAGRAAAPFVHEPYKADTL